MDIILSVIDGSEVLVQVFWIYPALFPKKRGSDKIAPPLIPDHTNSGGLNNKPVMHYLSAITK